MARPVRPSSRPSGRSILAAVDGLVRPSLAHRALVRYLPHRHATPMQPEATYAERFAAENPRWPEHVPGDFVPSPLSTPSMPVWEHEPSEIRSTRTVVHVHGGSYCATADRRHFDYLRRLSALLGCRALLPLYPLAPEHTWREVRPMAIDLLAEVAGAGELLLTGDSAGGGLALSSVVGLRDAGHPLPHRMALIAPWLDLRPDARGRDESVAADPWLHARTLEVKASWWAGSEDDRTRPEVSPILADLAGLPPTLVVVGTRDLLHPDSVALAQRASEIGWDLTLIEGPGLVHVYPLFPIPEALVALRQIADFLG